jgi:hypothetical protein
MREADDIARRRADRTNAVERVHIGQFRTGRLRKIETVIPMRVPGRVVCCCRFQNSSLACSMLEIFARENLPDSFYKDTQSVVQNVKYRQDSSLF